MMKPREQPLAPEQLVGLVGGPEYARQLVPEAAYRLAGHVSLPLQVSPTSQSFAATRHTVPTAAARMG